MPGLEWLRIMQMLRDLYKERVTVVAPTKIIVYTSPIEEIRKYDIVLGKDKVLLCTFKIWKTENEGHWAQIWAILLSS